MAIIRIGTRASQLAIWQADWVAAALAQRGHDIELVQVSTQGDITTKSLSQVGGQGLFTKAIQQRLISNEVDVAVHSLKDLPTEPVAGLVLAAVPERETTVDCLVSRINRPFEALPAGSRIGTGSSRRAAQLLAWRQDVVIADIRGNVDSRLRKLADGEYDAIVLAGAGLTRLGLLSTVTECLPMTRMLPAVGQGALGLECRASDQQTQTALAELDHAKSRTAVVAERQLLSSMQAGCLAPVAALARIEGHSLNLTARVLAVDGTHMLEGSRIDSIDAGERLGNELAAELLGQGADRLITLARG